MLKSLEQVDFPLSLNKSSVAIGNSFGASGDRYIRGRVDKACLRLTETATSEDTSSRRIGLVAELAEPYAVFLRNVKSGG
jgi:hypothetical protein